MEVQQAYALFQKVRHGERVTRVPIYDVSHDELRTHGTREQIRMVESLDRAVVNPLFSSLGYSRGALFRRLFQAPGNTPFITNPFTSRERENEVFYLIRRLKANNSFELDFVPEYTRVLRTPDEWKRLLGYNYAPDSGFKFEYDADTVNLETFVTFAYRLHEVPTLADLSAQTAEKELVEKYRLFLKNSTRLTNSLNERLGAIKKKMKLNSKAYSDARARLESLNAQLKWETLRATKRESLTEMQNRLRDEVNGTPLTQRTSPEYLQKIATIEEISRIEEEMIRPSEAKAQLMEVHLAIERVRSQRVSGLAFRARLLDELRDMSLDKLDSNATDVITKLKDVTTDDTLQQILINEVKKFTDLSNNERLANKAGAEQRVKHLKEEIVKLKQSNPTAMLSDNDVRAFDDVRKFAEKSREIYAKLNETHSLRATATPQGVAIAVGGTLTADFAGVTTEYEALRTAEKEYFAAADATRKLRDVANAKKVARKHDFVILLQNYFAKGKPDDFVCCCHRPEESDTEYNEESESESDPEVEKESEPDSEPEPEKKKPEPEPKKKKPLTPVDVLKMLSYKMDAGAFYLENGRVEFVDHFWKRNAKVNPATLHGYNSIDPTIRSKLEKAHNVFDDGNYTPIDNLLLELSNDVMDKYREVGKLDESVKNMKKRLQAFQDDSIMEGKGDITGDTIIPYFYEPLDNIVKGTKPIRIEGTGAIKTLMNKFDDEGAHVPDVRKLKKVVETKAEVGRAREKVTIKEAETVSGKLEGNKDEAAEMRALSPPPSSNTTTRRGGGRGSRNPGESGAATHDADAMEATTEGEDTPSGKGKRRRV